MYTCILYTCTCIQAATEILNIEKININSMRINIFNKLTI